jgi:ribosomal protein L32
MAPMFCSHCGASLPESAAFCPNCGRAIRRGPTCPQCAIRMPVGAAYCARCGYTLAPSEPSGPAVGEHPVNPDTLPTGDVVATSREAQPAGDIEQSVPVGTPPRVPAPESGERILPSNVGSWTAPRDEARPTVDSAFSRSEPYSPRKEWTYDPAPGMDASALIDPSVSGVYGYAWQTVKRHFWSLFAVGLVSGVVAAVIGGVIGGISGGLSSGLDMPFLNGVGQFLAQCFGSWPIWAGVQYANLQTVRTGRAEVADIFVPYRRGMINLIVVQVVSIILEILAFVFLIIPGIIVTIRLSFATLLVVDEEYGPIEALSESWRRTKGFGWTIFGLGILAVPIFILGLVALIVGVIPALMVIAITTPTMFAAATSVHGRRAYGQPPL